MKNLERISISSEKLLKNNELINLRGGEEEGNAWMKCTCDGPANPPFLDEWEKCYNDATVMTNDINRHCQNGGTCDNQHEWCNVIGEDQ